MSTKNVSGPVGRQLQVETARPGSLMDVREFAAHDHRISSDEQAIGDREPEGPRQ